GKGWGGWGGGGGGGEVGREAFEDAHGTAGPGCSMNVRCSSRTASSRRLRSSIHVMRNEEVATPLGAMPAASSAAVPRRTLANDALMPAPTTLSAPRSSTRR